MKEQYDFSKGDRGKFYRPNSVFKIPVYLDEKVQNYLAANAERKFESALLIVGSSRSLF